MIEVRKIGTRIVDNRLPSLKVGIYKLYIDEVPIEGADVTAQGEITNEPVWFTIQFSDIEPLKRVGAHKLNEFPLTVREFFLKLELDWAKHVKYVNISSAPHIRFFDLIFGYVPDLS